MPMTLERKAAGKKTPAQKATPKTATVRARVSPTIKERAEKMLAEQGLSPSDAIRLFYHHVIKSNGLPLSMCTPNAVTRKALKDVEAGKDLTRCADAADMFHKLGIKVGESEA